MSNNQSMNKPNSINKSFQLFLLLLLALPTLCLATNQIPDLIIFKGDTLKVHSAILQQDSSAMRSLQKRAPITPGLLSCNWKGYHVTWKIVSDSLCLHQLSSDAFSTSKQEIQKGKAIDTTLRYIPLSSIFPKKVSNQVLFANWYSGTLYTQQKRRPWLPNKDTTGKSTTSYDYIFTVKRGIIVSVIDQEEELRKAFDALQ